MAKKVNGNGKAPTGASGQGQVKSDAPKSGLESKAIMYQSPQSRHYIVSYERMHVEFPLNHEGYVKASRLTLSVNNPDVDELITKLTVKHDYLGDELEARAWRAAHIVTEGKVTLLPRDRYNTVGRVHSQSGNEVYDIQHRQTVLCTCPDYQQEQAPITKSGQRLCKHILAYLMAYELAGRPSEAELAAEQIAAEPDSQAIMHRQRQRMQAMQLHHMSREQHRTNGGHHGKPQP